MAEAAAAGLKAGGQILGGVGAYDAGKYNRRAARNEAINAERDGTVEEARIREAARAAMGQQVAAQGSNGFQIGTGSALDALQQSAINATLDALTARRQAAAKARSLRAGGEIAYAQGKNSLVQGLIGAGASVADYAADWAASKTGTTPAPKSSGIVMGGAYDRYMGGIG